MAIFRAYEVDSLGVSIAGTSATPILYFTNTTTDLNVARIKVMVEGASAPAPPSNGSVLFTVNKVTGTVGGGGAVTPQALSPQTTAVSALTTFTSANAAAITGLSQGVEYWGGVVPFTSGAWAEDTYENTGFELNVAKNALYCVYFIAASGAGSGCNARVMLWFAE